MTVRPVSGRRIRARRFAIPQSMTRRSSSPYGRIGQDPDSSAARSRVAPTGTLPAVLRGGVHHDDPQAAVGPVSPLLPQEGPAHGQAPQPRHVRVEVGRAEARARGAVLQAELTDRPRKGATMNWDKVEGTWLQLRGKVKERWGKLTNDDLDVISGKRDELLG